MRYYETMYIVHAALEAGRLKDLINSINGLLENNGNEILYSELWGKKKLAYFIDKQKYGTYILVQYKGDGSKNNDFIVELEHNPNVLTYLTTIIEESDIMEHKSDIDVQIDGAKVTSTDNTSLENKKDTKPKNINNKSEPSGKDDTEVGESDKEEGLASGKDDTEVGESDKEEGLASEKDDTEVGESDKEEGLASEKDDSSA